MMTADQPPCNLVRDAVRRLGSCPGAPKGAGWGSDASRLGERDGAERAPERAQRASAAEPHPARNALEESSRAQRRRRCGPWRTATVTAPGRPARFHGRANSSRCRTARICADLAPIVNVDAENRERPCPGPLSTDACSSTCPRLPARRRARARFERSCRLKTIAPRGGAGKRRVTWKQGTAGGAASAVDAASTAVGESSHVASVPYIFFPCGLVVSSTGVGGQGTGRRFSGAALVALALVAAQAANCGPRRSGSCSPPHPMAPPRRSSTACRRPARGLEQITKGSGPANGRRRSRPTGRRSCSRRLRRRDLRHEPRRGPA